MAWVNLDTVQRPSAAATLLTAWGDQVNDDVNYLYGDAAWTAPTYANSWVDLGGGNATGAFRKVGTRVVMRGTIKSGTINTTAFTLPVGYRPTATVVFACASNGAFGELSVASTGVVVPVVGSNTFFCLDGVIFDTI